MSKQQENNLFPIYKHKNTHSNLITNPLALISRLKSFQYVLFIICVCLLFLPDCSLSYSISRMQVQYKSAQFFNLVTILKDTLHSNKKIIGHQLTSNVSNLGKNNQSSQQHKINVDNLEQLIKQQNQNQPKYSKNFHSFIYPYNIFDIRHLTVRHLRQLMLQSDLRPPNQQNVTLKQNNTNQYKAENNSVIDMLIDGQFNNILISHHAYLFLKINNCVGVQACKLLGLLPTNFIILASRYNETLNLFKVSQSEFVIQSIFQQNTIQQNKSQSNKQNQPTEQPTTPTKPPQSQSQKQNIITELNQKSKVQLYNININNFLYFKINQDTNTTLNLQKMLVKSQVFQNLLQNSFWDVAYNGSSLRFVRLLKRNIMGNYNQTDNNSSSVQPQAKVQSLKSFDQKRIKKIPAQLKNIANQLYNLTSSQNKVNRPPQPLLTSYINTLQIVQYSINLHQQYKQYITKFYSHQYTPKNASHIDNLPAKKQKLGKQRTYRKRMIGNSFDNNFYLFLTTLDSAQKSRTRIFATTLNSLVMTNQFSTHYQAYGGQFLERMRLGNKQDILVYYQPQQQFNPLIQIQNRTTADDNNIVNVGKLYFRQLNAFNFNDYYNIKSNILSQRCAYHIQFNIDSIDQQIQIAPKIQKISEQFISICIQTQNLTSCKIVHSTCKQIYSYSIQSSILANRTIIWKSTINQLQYFDALIQILLQNLQTGQQQLYLSLQIATCQLMPQIKYVKSHHNKNRFGLWRINQSNRTYLRITNKDNSNITQFPYIDDDALYNNQTNSSNSSIQYQQQMSIKIVQQMQQIYFNYFVYKDRQKYRYMVGTRLMQKKLASLLQTIQHETTIQQQFNCQIQYDNSSKNNNSQNYSQIIGIGFGNYINRQTKLLQNNNLNQTQEISKPVWKLCRISLDTYHQNLVIQPQASSIITHNNTLQHPYKIYKCSLFSSSPASKCLYNQWQADKKLMLPQNSKSILFIQNRGQTYNIKISDLNTMQMDKIAQSFLIMFLILSLITCFFTCIIVCRPVCMIGLIYFGWFDQRTQPNFNFRYPLNCFQLKIKMRKMIVQEIIKQIKSRPKNSQSSNDISLEEDFDDNCVFCLQPKLVDIQMIEVYCKHTYHKDCFEEWVRQQSGQLNCPLCKRKISLDGLMLYRSDRRQDLMGQQILE